MSARLWGKATFKFLAVILTEMSLEDKSALSVNILDIHAL